MITKIKRSLELCMIITAQLQCALKACKENHFAEARRYLEMAKHTSEQVKREVNKNA